MILLALLVMTRVLHHESDLEAFELFVVSRQSLLTPAELHEPDALLNVELAQHLPELLDDLALFR